MNDADDRSTPGPGSRKLLATAGMIALHVAMLVRGVAYAQPALAAGVADADEGSPSATTENTADTLAEIVVTATRREERLQDIPYNISAVSGSSLAESGVTSLNGLANIVPGLQNIDTGPDSAGGNNNFTLRGLRTSGTGAAAGAPSERAVSVSTVSTYLGETPIFFPLALKDLNRVEVLKGPQGTLYGSGAEGGTIRLIPNRPDFDKFSGSVDVSGSGTKNAIHANGSIDGVLNVPLASNMAVRVAAGEEHLAGFIDAMDLLQRQQPGNWYSPPLLRVPSDPLSGYQLAPIQRGTNSSDEWYARIAFRWKITDTLETEVSYLHQFVHVADMQASNPTYPGGTFNFGYGGPLANAADVLADPNATNTYRPGGKYASTLDALSPATDSVDLASLLVTWDLGFATLTSSTSGEHAKGQQTVASTASDAIADGLGSYATSVASVYGGFPRFTYFYVSPSRDEVVTQELRLVSNGKDRINYVVGGYYQNQRYNYADQVYIPGIGDYIPSANPQFGDETYFAPFDDNGYHFLDRAVFGEVSYKITPQWQVTAGARFFWQDFTSFANSYFNWGGAAYSLDGTEANGQGLNVSNRSATHSHIKKFNSSYDITSNFKVYVTYSEGFRRGGANVTTPSGPFASLPQYLTFAPDTAKNYEVGIKGSAFDRLLTFDADVFLIDLDHFQFQNDSPAGYPLILNGSTARSKGFEFDAELHPLRNLTLSASYGYTEAKVRQGFSLQDYQIAGALTTPPTLVTALTLPAGARLPAVPANTVNLGADYLIPLANDSGVRLHLDAAYKDSAPATIDPTSVYYWVLPRTFMANARVTYDSGQSWTVAGFINNITNETAYNGGFGLQAIPSPFANRYVARPRTIGAELSYHF